MAGFEPASTGAPFRHVSGVPLAPPKGHLLNFGKGVIAKTNLLLRRLECNSTSLVRMY